MERRRSASLIREDTRDSSDWPDSASVMAEKMLDRGDKSHGNQAPAPTKSNRGLGPQQQQQPRQVNQASRKTDLEKLYWNGALNGGDQSHGKYLGNEKLDSNGFHHSATAAFDEVDKAGLWNGKMTNKPEPKRRSRSGSWAHTQTGYHQQQRQHQQQQQALLQQQLEEGVIEKFYWNDKIPGANENEQKLGGNKQSTAKLLASQAAQQANIRKAKLNGMSREFQNFNDEEKLYWNEKLGSSCVDISSYNGAMPAAGHNIKSSDMFGPNTLIKPVVGGAAGHGGGGGKGAALAAYRNYLQTHDTAGAPAGGRRLSKQLLASASAQARVAAYVGRPASSLGMVTANSAQAMLGSPSIRYNRHRRSSMSYYEENQKTQAAYNFPQPGLGRAGGAAAWRSNSMDALPFTLQTESDQDYHQQFAAGSQMFPGQQQQLDTAAAVNQKLSSMMRSTAFHSATQFTDQYTSSSTPVAYMDTTDTMVTDPHIVTGAPTPQLVDTSVPSLTSANTNMVTSSQHGGSNEDMKKVLMELDNTGYFAEELQDSSPPVTEQNKVSTGLQPQKQQQHQLQNGNHMDYKKLWEDSKVHNAQLQKELGDVRRDLDQVRSQLETMAIRAVNQKSVSDAEKREKLIVIKKLEGLEKELKLLAYSESLTDQTLEQLRLENNRLREENLALLRVMDKIVKN